jgi:GNAT superfamily N-acetyltransferase
VDEAHHATAAPGGGVIDIRRCRISEIMAAPNLSELVAAYSEECSLPELGSAEPQFDIYMSLDASGFFHPIAAFDDERIVGFIFPIVAKLPHYGVRAATIESFYVLKEYRAANVGLKLLAMAKEHARELGAKAMILSAPIGGVLSRLLDSLPDCRRSNAAYVTALA